MDGLVVIDPRPRCPCRLGSTSAHPRPPELTDIRATEDEPLDVEVKGDRGLPWPDMPLSPPPFPPWPRAVRATVHHAVAQVT
jgi:hypothetical protein